MSEQSIHNVRSGRALATNGVGFSNERSESPSRFVADAKVLRSVPDPSALRTTRQTSSASETAGVKSVSAVDDPAREQFERQLAIDVQPTLRQAWPRECPRPQYAFKISMFNVSCNSH